MASQVQLPTGMIATEPLRDVQTSTLRVGVGFAAGLDPLRATLAAAESARAGLRGATAHLALVVSAGLDATDPVTGVRSVLGPVGVAGGVTTRLLTECGLSDQGVVVVAMATEGDATNGVAAVPGMDPIEAGQSAARLIMAGWPFRLRYPRGLGIAFAGLGTPRQFLEAWRQFMGPKMRTICGVMRGGALFGVGWPNLAVSVACLEASYATGLGYAEGFASADPQDAEVLIHGAAEATSTALKRLNDRSSRLVLVLESAARHAALGPAAADEWQRVQAEVGDRAICVGWLCERVDAYGRGIQPADENGSLVVAAVGDGPTVTA